MSLQVLLSEVTGALSTRLPELFDAQLVSAGPAVRPQQLLETVRKLEPDLVLVELAGPPADVQKAIEQVMAEAPVPVLLVVHSAAQRQTAFSMLGVGALDVMQLPQRLDAAALSALRKQIVLLAQVTVVKHPRGRRRRTSTRLPALRPAYPVVAVAASLGGPRALAELLAAVPQGFGAPIVVCQHITPGFSDDLARWLAAETGLRVHEGADGQPLVKGEVFIAPAHLHMHVTPGGALKLDDGPAVGGFKPACDVLLRSVGQAFGPRAIGVVLTGMGRDGAKGLKEIRARGGHTVAQDEASCVVFGMPKEAIAAGGVEKVLPLAQIAPQLVRWVG
ncbi:MAG: chemotaxis protein CheB [Myxococcota bacterium]|jgi:two-component system chemotaxis response regulator CheB